MLRKSKISVTHCNKAFSVAVAEGFLGQFVRCIYSLKVSFLPYLAIGDATCPESQFRARPGIRSFSSPEPY